MLNLSEEERDSFCFRSLRKMTGSEKSQEGGRSRWPVHTFYSALPPLSSHMGIQFGPEPRVILNATLCAWSCLFSHAIPEIQAEEKTTLFSYHRNPLEDNMLHITNGELVNHLAQGIYKRT